MRHHDFDNMDDEMMGESMRGPEGALGASGQP
jgi:hypothetical protein